MVLQHKTRSSLLDLLKSHVEGNVVEKTVQTKPPTLLLLLLKFSNLTLLTKRGNETKRERTWWRKERIFPPRKLSPRKGANMPGSRKQGPPMKDLSWTGRVNTKLKFQPGLLPWYWMELPYPAMLPSRTSSRGRLAMWPTPWNRLYCYLLIWPTWGQWESMKYFSGWRRILLW